MNFLFISPNYPPIYYNFCTRLKAHGFTVIALGDTEITNLRDDLRAVLTEYVRVNLSDYDAVKSAVAGLIDRHGKIDGLESNNEYWLSTDAKLRRDFSIAGLLPDVLETYQYKSKMKVPFVEAGVATAPFLVTIDHDVALGFARKYGFPIFAKPDKGVGAEASAKLKTEEELTAFFAGPLPTDYIFEVYVEGELYSYDGLTDREGNLVFEASHLFTSPIDRLKETGEECVYLTLASVPPALSHAGRRTIKAFGLKGRFFHIEFFKLKKPIGDFGIGEFAGLEVNMRPAGGCTPEMLNFAHGIDIYDLWARCMCEATVPPATLDHTHMCVNVGRHSSRTYKLSPSDIAERYKDSLVFMGLTDTHENPFGNFEVIARFKTEAECNEFCTAVKEKA